MKKGGRVTTITLNEEQERMLVEVVRAGVARSAEEAVDVAIRSLHLARVENCGVRREVSNLADLFARSPFRGANLEFERERDFGRDFELATD